MNTRSNCGQPLLLIVESVGRLFKSLPTPDGANVAPSHPEFTTDVVLLGLLAFPVPPAIARFGYEHAGAVFREGHQHLVAVKS